MKYILGLDLGVASVGWAVLPCDYSEISTETLKMGSRIFDPGTDGKLEEGKDESRNLKRRTARGVRRNFWRRRRRAVKLFNILQNAGLLPSAACHTPEARQSLFNALDVRLMREYFPNADRVVSQTYIYRLRVKALDEQLSFEAIGRIFYALGQRRGFLSNKKTEDAEDKELGQVKGAIAELDKEMEAAGARTLGEYFANLDPEEEGKRIRARWVGRKAYVDEFEKIWEAQKRYYPEILTDALKEKVFKGIFYQRPLKSQKFLVLKCDLEPSRRVVAKGDPAFQEFRYWQRLIDLKVFDPAEWGYRDLTREEQDILAKELETSEKVTFTQMRKLLGLESPKKSEEVDSKRAWKFNFELDNGDSAIMGNRTRAKLRKALEDSGAEPMSNEELDKIAREILFYDSDSALAQKLLKLYPALSQEAADAISKVTLEPDYGSVSRKAIDKLLPVMKERRVPFATARKELYGEDLKERAAQKAVDILAPVEEALGAVRNPTVTRTLTEMRKVVNAIIRRYGKPECIRVELARDLKRGRKEREEIFKRNKEREKDRKAAEKKILDVMGQNFTVTGRDILKYRLWQECGGVCPYTGRVIGLEALFSDSSQFDIEHIIPFSISLDDSFGNKTLCYAEENRHVKKQMTPFQCYSKKPQWNEILERVKRFRGPLRDKKLRLFATQTLADVEAPTRLLNDTRYISKLAMKYLGTLYGAVNGNDAEGVKRVQGTVGDMSAWLRDAWNLNLILLSQDEKQRNVEEVEMQSRRNDDIIKKNRADHRHHAIDALVVALTDAKTIKRLSENADVFYDLKGRGGFALRSLGGKPCENFNAIVQEVVDGIIVSRRVDKKVSGPLHEETNYGKTVMQDKGSWRSIRKPVTAISLKDVDNIVDRKIRQIVKAKLEEVGGDPKNLENNPPYMWADSSSRRRIPIRSVRYWKNVKAQAVGKDGHERYVATGANHHLEIYAELDDKGAEVKWKSVVVSLKEAYRRVKAKEPVVQRDFGPKTKFKYSFSLGDAFTMNDGNIDGVWGVWKTKLGCVVWEEKLNTDARASKEIHATKGLRHKSGTFKEKEIGKIFIDVLGNIFPAND